VGYCWCEQLFGKLPSVMGRSAVRVNLPVDLVADLLSFGCPCRREQRNNRSPKGNHCLSHRSSAPPTLPTQRPPNDPYCLARLAVLASEPGWFGVVIFPPARTVTAWRTRPALCRSLRSLASIQRSLVADPSHSTGRETGWRALCEAMALRRALGVRGTRRRHLPASVLANQLPH
jgi:hypothetical protein